MSEGNIVCQGRVCYLFISLSGLPVEGSMGSHGRRMWVCYCHPGPCNHRLESYREQVYRGPHPHQHNMPPPNRTNYTASTPTHQPPPKNKLTLPLNQTVASAYTLKQWYFCCERHIKGSNCLITHLVLCVFISLYVSSHHLLPVKSFNRIRLIHLLYTDRWTPAVCILPLVADEETVNRDYYKRKRVVHTLKDTLP